jgi:glucan phosphoethanolaminetransferase (alkaline phosphatase superfamily)
MFIILAAITAFLICLVIWLMTRGRSDTVFLAPVVAGIILGVALLVVVSGQVDTRSKIQRFYATETTLQTARMNPAISALELAAIQQQIVECNQWLAESQYWAKNSFTNWFYPPRVLKLNPIK